MVKWLLDYISDKIDFRQYGGLKGNSITHYIIEFMNFILLSQDSSEQTAILACMVDFSKAFNRQNHNLLITKLSDMGVPGWLLKIVMAFLKNRKMVVKHKGGCSSIKKLPGGSPQGTILALLLFIVMINDLGFIGQLNNAGELVTCKKNMKLANEIHLKYVDDFSLAEAINLPEQLTKIPDSIRVQPDNYHGRTGHVLPLDKSRVYEQLLKTEEYAQNNQMKINYKKTKLILFNPCKKFDFIPNISLSGQQIEVVEEIRLLGLIIRSDGKWCSNTNNMIVKANKRLWILRRLRNMGAKDCDLMDVYIKQIRCILELGVPAWQGSLSQAEKVDLERIQKTACHIILGQRYESYNKALQLLELDTLESRRNLLSLKFALKAEKDEKFKFWFKPNEKKLNTRQTISKYCCVKANHRRFEKSPLSYLTNLLNSYHSN